MNRQRTLPRPAAKGSDRAAQRFAKLDRAVDCLLFGVPSLLVLVYALTTTLMVQPRMQASDELGNFLVDNMAQLDRRLAWRTDLRPPPLDSNSVEYDYIRRHGYRYWGMYTDAARAELSTRILERIQAGKSEPEQRLIWLYAGMNRQPQTDGGITVAQRFLKEMQAQCGLDRRNTKLLGELIFERARQNADDYTTADDVRDFAAFSERFQEPDSWMDAATYAELSLLQKQYRALPADSALDYYWEGLDSLRAGDCETAIRNLRMSNSLPAETRSSIVPSFILSSADAAALPLEQQNRYFDLIGVTERRFGIIRPENLQDLLRFCIDQKRLADLQACYEAIWRNERNQSPSSGLYMSEHLLSALPRSVLSLPGNEAFRRARLDAPALYRTSGNYGFQSGSNFPDFCRERLDGLELETVCFRSLPQVQANMVDMLSYAPALSPAEMSPAQRADFDNIRRLNWSALILPEGDIRADDSVDSAGTETDIARY